MAKQTHYEVLGLSQTADPETIRSTYLRLLQIYHPDHNKDAAANSKTKEIIEAYTVLGNPDKRRSYDQSLSTNGSSGPASAGTKSADPQTRPKTPDATTTTPLRELVCSGCGVQDATLRASEFYWVVSLIVVTRRGSRGNIWCDNCRVKQAVFCTLLSGAIGWWGFPWGPIFTIQALYLNARGGKQEKSDNAGLLRLLAYQMYVKGKQDQALAAIEASLRLEADAPSEQLADTLRKLGLAPPGPRKSREIATAAPSFAILGIIAVVAASLLNAPTGYAARYEAPDSVTTGPAATAALPSTRRKVNSLVEDLANTVHAHATYVGQHQKGTTTVHDFELDRSKYDPKSFLDIADEIEPFLADPGANNDGFASSAYFNAKLMGLSVSIENGFRAGKDVGPAIQEVYALRGELAPSGWLTASTALKPYNELVADLRFHELVRHGPRGARAGELELLKASISALKTEVETATTAGETGLAMSAAQKHDLEVDRYNQLVKQHNRLILADRNLDLAFNRCLDPKILMSKFQEVNLTSGSTTSDASLHAP